MTSTKKGFMLAAALMLVPICLILTFSLVRLIITGVGFGLQAQQKTKAFYLAEAGLNVGFQVFGLGNFTAVTHQPDGTKVGASDDLAISWPPNFDLQRQGDGWIAWTYDPAVDPIEKSFTRSGLEESYRFRVWFPDDTKPLEWRVDCEAVVGNRLANHQLAGILENPQQYLVFDNGDLADLARSSHQELKGQIHTNGDIYLAPWRTTGFAKGPFYIVPPSTDTQGNTITELQLTDADITAGEDLIRRHDYWGRSEGGIQVSVNGKSLGTSSSNYFDSLSPQWNSGGIDGALSVFAGKVKTRDVGARQKGLPHSQAFEPGGYYDQHATLKIGENTAPSSWLKTLDIYNEAEKQKVRVAEVDLKKLHASGQWPDNGLLYSSTPIRLTNGADLGGALTVVCSETVYLQGDFNKKYRSAADQANDTHREKPASIMTADRIYRITDDIVDDSQSNYAFPLTDPDLYIHGLQENKTKFRPATDPPKFPGDPNNVIESNVVLVDSTPTEDTAAFAFADRGHPSAYNPALKVRLYTPPNGETEFVFPSSEDFLENVSGLRFEHSGSEIHLRNATMVNGMFNEEYDGQLRQGSGPTPYVLRSVYIPPSEYWFNGPESEKPGIFRSANDMVSGLAGQPLPFALRSARRTFWAAE